MWFCFYVTFLLRDQWLIERLREAMGAALVGEIFLKRAGRGPQRLPPTRKRHVFVLARPTHASRAGARPQELGHWFCPFNLWLSSGTSFGEIASWPAGARTWTQTWTLSPDQLDVKILSAQKPQNKLCGVWILFRSVKNAEIEDIAGKISTLIPQTEPSDFRSQRAKA